MNILNSFPSKYLRADELQGREALVIICDVREEIMTLTGGQKVTKPVVYFRGKKKGLVLNKTNATAIAALVGSPETRLWKDRPIRLYGATTSFGDKTVACVRVKAAAPASVLEAVPA